MNLCFSNRPFCLLFRSQSHLHCLCKSTTHLSLPCLGLAYLGFHLRRLGEPAFSSSGRFNFITWRCCDSSLTFASASSTIFINRALTKFCFGFGTMIDMPSSGMRIVPSSPMKMHLKGGRHSSLHESCNSP